MAELQKTITKSDGLFNSTFEEQNAVWEDYTSLKGAGTLYKVNVGDFIQGAITCQTTGMVDPYIWDAEQAKWKVSSNGKSVADAYGCNIVMMGTNRAVYIATDGELGNIPNFTESSALICRINSHVTHDNFTSFRRIAQIANENGGIPLNTGYVYPWNSSGVACALSTIKASINNNNMLVGGFISDAGSKFVTKLDSLGRINMNTYFKAPNTAITDLETRLTLLEQEYSKLKVLVDKHEEILKDLPALIAAVSSNTTKYYVAR